MPAKKAAAQETETRASIIKLRPTKPKAAKSDGAALFSLQKEMLQVLQRVSGNKSKRTASVLIDEGPIRAFVVALDKGATLDQDSIDGNASVQVLIGEVEVKVGRAKKRLRAGDLLVLESGSARGAEAIEPAALLITVAVGEKS